MAESEKKFWEAFMEMRNGEEVHGAEGVCAKRREGKSMEAKEKKVVAAKGSRVKATRFVF